MSNRNDIQQYSQDGDLIISFECTRDSAEVSQANIERITRAILSILLKGSKQNE